MNKKKAKKNITAQKISSMKIKMNNFMYRPEQNEMSDYDIQSKGIFVQPKFKEYLNI